MNRWTKLTEALSELPIIEQINDEKRQLDAIRPLSEAVEGRVMQKIRLDWNFHSNAIEGNKLTFGETYTFLMYGLTAKGKPLKDHLDIKGHNEAINFLISVVKDDADLRETDIRDLHKMVLVEPYQSPAITPDGHQTSKIIAVGAYKKMPNHVKTPTGEMHYYANPEDVPILMGELVQWYNEARKNPKIHPSVLAAFFHHRFVAIHPFDDGNGRVARILMNLILMQKGYPPAVVKLKERTDYYAALGQADKNEYVPVVEFVAETVLASLTIYLKAARGESIEEDSDIDKEIALFKGSFRKKFKTKDVTKEIFKNVFQPIIYLSEIKLAKFDDLFNSKNITYLYEENLYEHPFSDKIIDVLPKVLYLEQIDNVFKNKDFNRISYTISWFDFNRGIKNKDFFSFIEIIYNENDYQIKCDRNQVLLSKQYNEIVYDLEKQNVAKEWVKITFQNLRREIDLPPPQ